MLRVALKYQDDVYKTANIKRTNLLDEIEALEEEQFNLNQGQLVLG